MISPGVTRTGHAVKGAMDVPARYSAPGVLLDLGSPELESGVTEPSPYRRGGLQPR
jgi:hypothetical protein